jgi:hypothetical protein
MHFRIRVIILVTFLAVALRSGAQTSLIDSIIAPATLQYLVETLAHDSMLGRLTGTVQAGQAAHLIADEFRKAGALPLAGNDGYLMSFYSKFGGVVNVIAALPGKSKAQELVLFSAHYDHVGIKSNRVFKMPEKGNPEKDDEIYNGANDNASGVSGLIHLARYFAHAKNNERTLIFIAFSGEELGLLGSERMARSFNPKVVQAMINMDMIGRGIQNNNHPFITGADRSNLQTILNKKLFELAPEYGKIFFKPDHFITENLFKRSDNFWFAMNGIPAHTIMTSSPYDIYYHSLNDEADKLDYELMAKVVKAIALGCTGLAAGTDKPKRLNVSGLQTP